MKFKKLLISFILIFSILNTNYLYAANGCNQSLEVENNQIKVKGMYRLLKVEGLSILAGTTMVGIIIYMLLGGREIITEKVKEIEDESDITLEESDELYFEERE